MKIVEVGFTNLASSLKYIADKDQHSTMNTLKTLIKEYFHFGMKIWLRQSVNRSVNIDSAKQSLKIKKAIFWHQAKSSWGVRKFGDFNKK